MKIAQEAVVTLRYYSETPINYDTVRALLHGLPIRPKEHPAEFMVMSLRTVPANTEWVQEQAVMEQVARLF